MSETDEERSSDPILELLITMKEAATTPCHLTLNVGGCLISGYLISYDEYLEAFMFGHLKQGFDDAREQLKAQGKLEEDNEKEESSKPPRRFIHLKDARFFHPGGVPIPANEGVLWRGKLSAVDGFLYGLLEVANP